MKRTTNIKQEHIFYGTSPETGLSDLEVQKRIENGEINRIKDTTEKTYAEIIIKNFFSFFNILMITIAAFLLIFVGIEVILNLTFLLLAIINTLIGTIQECRSRAALKKLKLLTKNKAIVIRNSEEKEILSDEIVLEDIIILKSGDQIPADCILVENKILEVNESLLTGESVPVKKHNGEKIFAGSFVVSGSSRVKAVAVGEDTYIHSIEAKTKVFKQPKSRLLTGINKIIKTLACIAVPLALIVFVNQIMRLGTENYKDAIKNAGLIIPYMIPAGMILLSSMSMMTGVITLSKKNVMAQDLSSVEALSRVDVLCLDKTGTLTDGTMTIEKSLISNKNAEVIISSYMSAFDSENQTSLAIIKKYGKEQILKPISVLEFSSARKYSAVKFENGDLYALGAPEYLMPENKELFEMVNQYSANGSRVVILIKVNSGKLLEDKLEIKKAEEVATFVIRDNIRAEVPDAMKWFTDNGVDIKIISGDNLGTVSYIAKHSGVKNWDKCVDMSKISDKDNLEEIVMNNGVFARVSPEQKAEIVDILKKNKKTVAMTGDGINDIVALKKADCSIALSNGAQATKNISNLILLDSNFANMKEAVFEGRRVVNNIQRSSTLFVMKDFLWMFITLWPILFGFNMDLEPTVMTIVNTFITGVGSLFLALEPDKRKIEGDFIKNVIGTGIVSGFYMFLPVIFSYIYAISHCGFDISAISEYIKGPMFPVISICITIAGFVIFAKISKPFTKYRRTLYICILCLVIFLLVLIPDFFMKNGSDFIMEIINQYGSNMLSILYGVIKKLFSFEIYFTLDWGHWVMIGTFLLLSTVLYRITDKIVSKCLKITMFNPHRFDDVE